MRRIIESGNLVSLGAACEGGYIQENSSHSVTDGDAIIAAIWRVPVELIGFDEGKNTACVEEGL